MNIFSVTNLHFLHYGPINLQIKQAEIIGLSGASGSGKSRFLRALADLDEHRGEIQLDDIRQQQIEAHQWRKKVALLPAETSWWYDTVAEHFTGFSELAFSTKLQALGFAGDISGWSIARLSSGEKQRLGLLRLLQNQPDVILLDEPTANLDQNNTELFENFVKAYLNERSACAIWVSHDTGQLQKLCQRKFVMQDGEML